MGKNLRGKELGACLSQRKDGRYSARFVTACGKRVEKYFESYQDARKWLAEARLLNDMAEGYAGSTIQQTLITLYNLFQCAFENGLIISNPVTRTVKLPKPVVENTRVLTVDDQEKFLAQAKNSTNYPQYFFILNTGVRTGEMIGLKLGRY